MTTRNLIRSLERCVEKIEEYLSENPEDEQLSFLGNKTITDSNLLIDYLDGVAPPISDIDIRDYQGLTVTLPKGGFYDVDGFENLSGDGDYTFIAWFDSASGNPLLYGQNTSLNGPDRLTIMGQRIYTKTATDTYSTKTGLGGIVVTRTFGITKSTYIGDNGIETRVLAGLEKVDLPTLKLMCSDYQSPRIVNTAGDSILAIQYIDYAISDQDATILLENYTIHGEPTQEFLFFENTSGSSDNGAYPATMSDAVTPSPYVVTASYAKPNEDAWKVFDDNLESRTILQDVSQTNSAGAWLKIDLGVGNEQACDQYLLRNWAGQGASSFTISGSNDDVSWTDLYTGSSIDSNAEIQKHRWINETTYRYYRVTCNTGYHSGQWTTTLQLLIDQNKEWISGGGYAVDGTLTFPN